MPSADKPTMQWNTEKGYIAMMDEVISSCTKQFVVQRKYGEKQKDCLTSLVDWEALIR